MMVEERFWKKLASLLLTELHGMVTSSPLQKKTALKKLYSKFVLYERILNCLSGLFRHTKNLRENLFYVDFCVD